MAKKRFGIVKKIKKFNPNKSKAVTIMLWLVAFAAIGGVVALYLTRAAEPIRVDTSLPQPRNVRAYPDDRVITVTWDEPQNASSAGIVGYFVEYGETSAGTFPYTKQTTYNAVQIQPIDNNKQYSIRVYAAHGSSVMVATPDGHDDGSAPEMRGSGRVSSPVTVTATPVSTRVDQLRQRMTGFFDDFNTQAGPMDELKWNQAGSSCGQPGTYGAFINNQHHAHNQVSTIRPGGADEYCDRGQMATRARGVFDIAGRTDSSPGEMVFDIDGAADIEKRSIWYLDLIPTTARTNGAPVDVTAHASIFDDERSDPMGIRIAQDFGSLRVLYYDANKDPHDITPTFNCTNSWQGYGGCDASNKTQGLSPLAEPSLELYPIPNLRRHWVVRMTTSKITIFIDSVRVFEGPIPAEFRNITKYQVHSTIFGYNIGKDNPNNATTFLFHWDNFGFNGPASPTVTHSYMEGGPTGTTPYIGRGSLANQVPRGARTTVVPIPDNIGSPVKARVHYTLTAFGPGWYNYSPSHNIRVNGTTYSLVPPNNQVPAPAAWPEWDSNQFANGNSPMSLSVDINPAHLVRGNNQIQLNIDGHYQAIMNVHIELEYARGSQPSYTQPTQIFGLTALNSFAVPPLHDHDKYLFIEQNLGLTSADGHGHTDPPTNTDGQAPSIQLTAPANNATVSNNTIQASATATDNVGVSRVEFWIGNQLRATDESAPYQASLDFTSFTPGPYSITARAYDAAGNSSTTSAVSVTKPQPQDTTMPTITAFTPANGYDVPANSTSLKLTTTATDNVGVTRMDFFVDNILIGSSTTPESGNLYSHTFNPSSLPAGNHLWRVEVRDAAGNVRVSNNWNFDTVSPTVDPDPEPEPDPDPLPEPNPEPAKPGDLTGDGRVNFADLALLLANYGKNVPNNQNGDLNNSGTVTFADLAILLSNYGK